MKNCFILLCFISFTAAAQQNQRTESRRLDSLITISAKELKGIFTNPCYCLQTKVKGDTCSSLNKYTRGNFITLPSFNKLLRKDFTLITLNEEGLPSLGNYASVKYSENDTRVNLNGSFYNIFDSKDESQTPIKNILSVGINAGIKDNVSKLVSESKINSKAGLNLKFSVIGKKTRFNYSQVDCAVMGIRRKRLGLEYDMANENSKIAELKINKEIDSLGRARKETVSLIAIEERRLKDNPDNNDLTRLLDLRSRINRIDSEILKARGRTGFEDVLKENKKKFEEKLFTLETTDLKFSKIRMQWFDVLFDVTGESYTVYNGKLPIMPLDTQFTDESFQRYSFGLAYNNFIESDTRKLFRYGFLTKITYRLENDNSLTGADQEEVVTSKIYATDTLKREVIGKKTVYTIPFSKYTSHVVNMQFTKYLSEKKNNAISLYTEFRSKNKGLFKNKPAINAGVGYFFSVNKKDDLKSLINLEVYLKFNDILNSKKKDTSLFQRNEIGVKIGVPFNSIFINQ